MAHNFFTRVFLLQSLAAHAAASAATYDINVFYSTSSEDCTSDPTATQTIGAGECDCLDTEPLLGCLASIKLGTNGGTGKDSTLTANFYAGNSCDGTSLGGDTTIECDKCHSIDVPLVPGTLAIQLACPFSCWGLCLDIGIAAGVPCILFTIICSCGICCGGAAVAKTVQNKRPAAAPMTTTYMQAPQGMVQPMQGMVQPMQQTIYQ